MITKNSYDEYINNAKDGHYSIDGGIVLLRPNIDEYNNYMNLLREVMDQSKFKIRNR